MMTMNAIENTENGTSTPFTPPKLRRRRRPHQQHPPSEPAMVPWERRATLQEHSALWQRLESWSLLPTINFRHQGEDNDEKNKSQKLMKLAS